MLVLDALKNVVKSAVNLDVNVRVKPGVGSFSHFAELDDIIESMRGTDNVLLDTKIGVNGNVRHSVEHIIKSIDDIYINKFGTHMPKEILNTLRAGVRKSELEHIINNTTFMNDRVDSVTRIMSKISENVNGYRDALDNIHNYLRDNLPPKATGTINMTGGRYRIVMPVAAITAGTGSYVFYKAFVKAVCENNTMAGCIWTRHDKKCKIVMATCDPVHKQTEPNLMPACTDVSSSIESICSGWDRSIESKSICRSCDKSIIRVNTGTVECIEPPTMGAIILDALDTGLGDINTAVSAFGSFINGFIKYAHYGFLFVIFVILSVIYSRLRYIASATDYSKLNSEFNNND